MKLLHYLLIPILLFSFSLLHAQVFENFSDGDFTANPAWSGTASKFLVNGGLALQSNGNSASGDTLALSTPNSLFDSVEFSFSINLGFNPSSTNYVRVYLASDSSNLRSSLNGYYLQLGETGSNDTIKIFKQTGNTAALVFTGNAEVIGSSAVSANVKCYITRSSAGVWKVYADKTGGSNYTLYGTFTDNSWNATAHFGFYARYSTASRFDKYVFDDIEIRHIVGDTTKPVVVNVSVVNATQLDVLFSEQVSLADAQSAANYQVNNGIGVPQSAVLDGVDKRMVHLTLSSPLVSGNNYSISINGIADMVGNTMLPQQLAFNFFVPQLYDVLINEIMADPDPKVGLPGVEFVELHNRSSFPIDLGSWTFSDASTTIVLPSVTIPKDSFAVIVHKDSALQFSAMGAIVVSVNSLPSLNNDKDSLTLKNPNGNVIHSIAYSDSWYGDDNKKQGGYTLELRNPLNPCAADGNWMASTDASGGTPGRQNAVYDATLDLEFRAGNVRFAALNAIAVSFTEVCDAASATTVANYNVDNGMGNPQYVYFDSVVKNAVVLYFNQNFDTSTIYKLTVSGVKNCVSLGLQPSTFTLAFPQRAARYDVLITEIMADPDPVVELPNREYIELYNRSSKAISLKNWQLGKIGASSAALLPDVLLMPDAYLLLCSVTAAGDFSAFTYPIGVSSFPSLNNTGDAVFLKDNTGVFIHAVEYADTWYGTDSKKNGGWSLEMIDANNWCSGAANWSASVSTSGGTPGSKNSIAATKNDSALLNIVRAALLSDTVLGITFNKSLDSAAVVNANFYTVSGNIGKPQSVEVMPHLFNRVLLKFSQPFLRGTTYSIKVNGLNDCAGNGIGINDTARFALADSIAPNDIVINEMLFNPATAGVDYVELYNRSQKVLDIAKLVVEEREVSNPENVLEKSDTLPDTFLLFPDEYAVFTTNTDMVKAQYNVKNPQQLLLLKKLPNFPDDAGICVLKSTAGIVIDSLCYAAQWHYALLDEKDGVSLERINYNQPTNDRSNWHSAAGDIGFGTPTYLNSQFYTTGISDDAIAVEPEVFSPDNDGYKDFTLVKYRFTEPGYQASIRIFDAIGREVKYLVKTETLSATGEFQWDGTNNDGGKARTGIYTVFVEVFNLQGKTKRFKKNVVLGARLD
ncbi:MAG: lamin tail domain-containing protein [Chitinophagales bacterium]